MQAGKSASRRQQHNKKEITILTPGTMQEDTNPLTGMALVNAVNYRRSSCSRDSMGLDSVLWENGSDWTNEANRKGGEWVLIDVLVYREVPGCETLAYRK